MSDEQKTKLRLEIGHVLFLDIVGYSKLLRNQQTSLLREMTEAVLATNQVRQADAERKLLRLATGDGMALVFRNNPEAPVECAMEISRALASHRDLRLRMGIHSGPVDEVSDVNERTNVAGAGINTAQRVMDFGDAGHILLSQHVADDLEQDEYWQPFLHELGECEVKHGVKVRLVNFYHDEIGNSRVPAKLKQARKQRATRRGKLLLGVTLPVVLVAALLAYRWRHPSANREIPQKSIAVLPFDNFSADKENAFFADGIQDDILTSLAKVRDLRVISRTSTESYRNNKEPRNLREIGKALGVANILEGSVRRDGNRVAVTVQLIETTNDRHLWANRYDRTIADSLGLQGELAAEIASALHAVLSPEEKARVESKPTDNPDAYVFYLRASQIAHNPDTLLEDYKTAEQLYLQAIALDPKFALAHARLATTCAEIYHYYEPLETWKAKAISEAKIALQLHPSLSEAHRALGLYVYWIEGDFARALQELKMALALSPSNAEVGSLIASIKRRQGHWQESLDAYEQAQKIDPQNANIMRNLLFTYTALRRWPEAARVAERFRAMAPGSLVAKTQSGYVDFLWKGETASLKTLLRGIPAGTDPDGEITSVRWDVAMIERDYDTARKVLRASSLTEFSYTNAAATPKAFFEGCIALALGDTAGAQKDFADARPQFESAVQEAPESAERHANLGWLYAFMGRREDAIREGRRAVELKPESKDAVDGAIMKCYLALIYARLGEKELALPLIERLLQTPGAVDSVDYSITVNDLKHRWEWDPLRGDPRFEKIVASLAPK